MKNEVLTYLKEDPRFRERSAKNKGIANLIMKKYGIEIPKDKRDDIVSDILSADRAWRMNLKENPDLQGSDYKQGEILEQQWELQHGYEPNYHADIKKLKTI